MVEPVAYLAWDDLRFPAQGIDPAGSAAPPSRDTSSGALLFSGTLDNVVSGIAQMPHRWAAGTGIRPHIHLVFTTSAAANTRWKLEYSIANVNDPYPADLGTYPSSEIITVANPENVRKNAVASWSEISMDGKRDSCIILWRVSRLAASDVADDHTADVALLEFDIHYQASSHGSSEERPSPFTSDLAVP